MPRVRQLLLPLQEAAADKFFETNRRELDKIEREVEPMADAVLRACEREDDRASRRASARPSSARAARRSTRGRPRPTRRTASRSRRARRAARSRTDARARVDALRQNAIGVDGAGGARPTSAQRAAQRRAKLAADEAAARENRDMLSTVRRQGKSVGTLDELESGLVGVIADGDAANARWLADHRHRTGASDSRFNRTSALLDEVDDDGRRHGVGETPHGRRRPLRRLWVPRPPGLPERESPVKLRGVGVDPKTGGVAYIERDEGTKIAMAITRATEMDEWLRGGGRARRKSGGAAPARGAARRGGGGGGAGGFSDDDESGDGASPRSARVARDDRRTASITPVPRHPAHRHSSEMRTSDWPGERPRCGRSTRTPPLFEGAGERFHVGGRAVRV